jgi:polysaccharide pyruvyl transferase WcaK-like protein
MSALAVIPVGEQQTAPTELEINCNDSKQQTPAKEKAGSGLAAALLSIDASRLHSVTVILADQENSGDILSVLTGAIQNWPIIKTLVVRLKQATLNPAPEALIDLFQICQNRNIHLRIDFLLDGQLSGFEALASVPGALPPLLDTGRALKQHGIPVRWLIPIVSKLVYRLEGLVSLARDEEIEPLLLPPEIISLPNSVSDLSDDEKLFFRDFLTCRLLESDRNHLKSGQTAYYQSLVAYLDGLGFGSGPGAVPVLTREGSHGWQLKIESIPGADMRSRALDPVISEADKSSSLQGVADQAREVAHVLWDGVQGHVLRSMVGIARGNDALKGRSFGKVLLIGAYGGEHIGDTAILGGVLCRLHERFGTRQAILLTQRLAHTRHLLHMLDCPVELTADVYERAEIKKHIAEVDCVVFAGGPLIDLPKQLVRHLYTVSLARKMGKPFIAEGIGPGPFVRWPSKFTARRLIEMADQISLRSADLVDHEIVRGLDVEVGHCPSFDYLQTRGDELTRLAAVDRVSIEKLLADTEGRPLIGVNIRPINHLYTVGAPAGEVAAHTRKIEARFEHRFAEGLRTFSDQAEIKPCFIFFPMNAIQFGSSDLLSAYRLQRILGSSVDFRVWEADASLDGVLSLLRQLDIAITMRFHAAIFALSQNCKVIGVDYRIGRRDKIAGLMDDFGQGEYCTRIDLLTGEWLAKKLDELNTAQR